MKILLYGGTGQAKVVRPIIEAQGHRVAAVFDRNVATRGYWNCAFASQDDELLKLVADCDGFVVCIGGTSGAERTGLSGRLLKLGLTPVEAIHPTAHIAMSARLGLGLQAMARAVVSEDAEIGDWCILNTNCTLDHECRVGSGVHIMGNAALAGCVEVGKNASIGTNATILPRLRIGDGAIVGAGAVVTRDVEAGSTVIGNPARKLTR